MDIYDLCLKNKTVGTVQVERVGLYLHFTCRCRFPQKDIYKITVMGPSATVNLGTLIPAGDEFVLQRKLPLKYVGEGNYSFRVLGARQDACIMPVYADKPFGEIPKLRYATLVHTDVGLGLRLRSVNDLAGADLQGSDLIP